MAFWTIDKNTNTVHSGGPAVTTYTANVAVVINEGDATDLSDLTTLVDSLSTTEAIPLTALVANDIRFTLTWTDDDL